MTAIINWLSRAFVFQPSWANGPIPIKWQSWEHFAKANSFNAGYGEV